VPEKFNPIYLATAIEAVIRAGEVQMQHFGHEMRVDKKGAIDLVTEIDLQIEREFRALIAERFPDHVVLGEEFSAADERHQIAEYSWVFDPVDGTTNFAHGLPIFCSSLALEIHGQPVAAAVYDPTRRELFTAQRGLGAWLNGKPLRVSSAETLMDALLCTGFPYTVQQKPEELIGLFGHFLSISRAVRRLGSAAIDLCYVATGRLDGFWEQRLSPWDISAGALIVQEAGGVTTTVAGEPFNSRLGNIVASNGRIHDQMVGAIQEFKAHFRAPKGTD
jgi:myo-inositol-1(or 4)-monophosphatase